MRKYFQLFKNHYAVSLTYRANIVSNIILETLFSSSIIILWTAIYKTNPIVGGFNFSHTVLYYLLVPLMGYFTTVSQANRIAKDIKNGMISNHLIKPYKPWGSNFVEQAGFKLTYLTMILPIYFFIFTIFLSSELQIFTRITNVLSVILLIILATVLNFVMELCLGYCAFWLDEVYFLNNFKTILLWLFGGISFPLDFLPKTLRPFFDFLPFKYSYYTPINTLITPHSTDIITNITGCLGWTLFFILLATLMWKKGLKRYGAFGN